MLNCLNAFSSFIPANLSPYFDEFPAYVPFPFSNSKIWLKGSFNGVNWGRGFPSFWLLDFRASKILCFFLFLRLGCPRWRNKSDGITSIHIQTTHSWERSSLYSYSSPLGYTRTLPALGIWSLISCAKHISSCHLSVGLWPELKGAFPTPAEDVTIAGLFFPRWFSDRISIL